MKNCPKPLDPNDPPTRFGRFSRILAIGNASYANWRNVAPPLLSAPIFVILIEAFREVGDKCHLYHFSAQGRRTTSNAQVERCCRWSCKYVSAMRAGSAMLSSTAVPTRRCQRALAGKPLCGGA